MQRTGAIYKAATEYYKIQLHSSQYAQKYLAKRGITIATALSFNLGYAPDKVKGLLEYLEENFNLYDIIASGLFKIVNDKLIPYFIDRIIFPIYIDGEVFSFTSRTVSRQTPAKHKHMSKIMNCFYNEDALRYPIVVVTESPIDAIIFQQVGYPAVATMGSNLKLAEKLGGQGKVYVAFDNDCDKKFNPGLDFALKFGYNITKYAQPEQVMIIEFPASKDGKKVDANSYYLSNQHSARSFGELIRWARPIKSYPRYWQIITSERRKAERRVNKTKGKMTLDDIKLIPLENVIQKYIDIETTFDFSDRILCKCPFHNDTIPSMTIYKESNTFICRGASCGKHGDVIQFVQYADGVSFQEACRRLKEDLYGQDSELRKDLQTESN